MAKFSYCYKKRGQKEKIDRRWMELLDEDSPIFEKTPDDITNDKNSNHVLTDVTNSSNKNKKFFNLTTDSPILFGKSYRDSDMAPNKQKKKKKNHLMTTIKPKNNLINKNESSSSNDFVVDNLFRYSSAYQPPPKKIKNKIQEDTKKKEKPKNVTSINKKQQTIKPRKKKEIYIDNLSELEDEVFVKDKKKEDQLEFEKNIPNIGPSFSEFDDYELLVEVSNSPKRFGRLETFSNELNEEEKKQRKIFIDQLEEMGNKDDELKRKDDDEEEEKMEKERESEEQNRKVFEKNLFGNIKETKNNIEDEFEEKEKDSVKSKKKRKRKKNKEKQNKKIMRKNSKSEDENEEKKTKEIEVDESSQYYFQDKLPFVTSTTTTLFTYQNTSHINTITITSPTSNVISISTTIPLDSVYTPSSSCTKTPPPLVGTPGSNDTSNRPKSFYGVSNSKTPEAIFNNKDIIKNCATVKSSPKNLIENKEKFSKSTEDEIQNNSAHVFFKEPLKPSTSYSTNLTSNKIETINNKVNFYKNFNKSLEHEKVFGAFSSTPLSHNKIHFSTWRKKPVNWKGFRQSQVFQSADLSSLSDVSGGALIRGVQSSYNLETESRVDPFISQSFMILCDYNLKKQESQHSNLTSSHLNTSSFPIEPSPMSKSIKKNKNLSKNSPSNKENYHINPQLLSKNSHSIAKSPAVDRTGRGSEVGTGELTLSRDQNSTINQIMKNFQTDLDQILLLSKQSKIFNFAQAVNKRQVKSCIKIGEGLYGEVFKMDFFGYENAVKVIPVDGKIKVNGEDQKNLSQTLPEIVISQQLSGLSKSISSTPFHTEGFIKLNSMKLVKGVYPQLLLKAWDDYNDAKVSENDRPDYFDKDQFYIMLCYELGGNPLVDFKFGSSGKGGSLSGYQLVSILKQISFALACAEERFLFEHRDLHLGNILIQQLSGKEKPWLEVSIRGQKYKINHFGVKVNIIDFTLSRMTIGEYTFYQDLSTDEELFQGMGDPQFEVYRQMRSLNDNQWLSFNPGTNLLWLGYLLEVMSQGLERNLYEELLKLLKPSTSCLNFSKLISHL